MTDCIFCKIIQGDIPCQKIYEDSDFLAFCDIHPAAPVHFLIIPKIHIDSLAHSTHEHQTLLGKLMTLAPQLASDQGLDKGFRLVINTGQIGRQEVYHLHIHILGGSEPLRSIGL